MFTAYYLYNEDHYEVTVHCMGQEVDAFHCDTKQEFLARTQGMERRNVEHFTY